MKRKEEKQSDQLSERLEEGVKVKGKEEAGQQVLDLLLRGAVNTRKSKPV